MPVGISQMKFALWHHLLASEHQQEGHAQMKPLRCDSPRTCVCDDAVLEGDGAGPGAGPEPGLARGRSGAGVGQAAAGVGVRFLGKSPLSVPLSLGWDEPVRACRHLCGWWLPVGGECWNAMFTRLFFSFQF